MNAIFAFIKKEAQNVKDFFVSAVDPVLENFVKQFMTDFGKAALVEAAPLAQALLNGEANVTIQTQAKTLVENLAAKGITLAESDAMQVALNAIRVNITPQQPDVTVSQ